MKLFNIYIHGETTTVSDSLPNDPKFAVYNGVRDVAIIIMHIHDLVVEAVTDEINQ